MRTYVRVSSPPRPPPRGSNSAATAGRVSRRDRRRPQGFRYYRSALDARCRAHPSTAGRDSIEMLGDRSCEQQSERRGLPRATSSLAAGWSASRTEGDAAPSSGLPALLGRGRQEPKFGHACQLGYEPRAHVRALLAECFALEGEEITLRLNLYTGNGLSVRQVETRWLEFLELPRTCLRKHTLNNPPAPTSGVKKNKLPYGVATLGVRRSTWLVQHIFGAIQEYGGFDEPRWLDCGRVPHGSASAS